MELKLKDINVCNYNKKLDTACSVEADIIVPDTKPDIYRILCVNATSDLDEQYIKKGKIVFSGNVKFNILYIGETDKSRIYSIEYSAPFNHQSDITGADDNFTSISKCSVSSTDFKVKNSRKLSAKCMLSINFEAINYTAENVLEAVSGEDTAPSKQRELSCDIMTVCKNFKFSFSDTITLPASSTPSEILDFNVNLDTPEIKTVNNKAIIKANLPAKVFYLSGSEPSVYETEFSFTEIADLDSASPESTLISNFDVSDINYVVSNTDDVTTVDLDIKVVGYIKSYEKQDCTVISDIYSPDYKYSINKKKAGFEKLSKQVDSGITLKDTLSSDSGISKVYYMNVYPSLKEVKQEASSVKLSGNVQTSVIYSDSEGEIRSTKKDIPYEIELPMEIADSDNTYDVSVSAVNYGYVLGTSHDIQARIVLKAGLSGHSFTKETIITDFTEDKNSTIDKSSQPSITVCYPSENACLWDYAVKYNTTCEEIAAVNKIEPDAVLEKGNPILIPKRVRLS